MLVYTNTALEKYKSNYLQIQPFWNRRDFVKCAQNYLDSSVEKIFAIIGLRGTGKTVGLLQATEGRDIAYVLTQKGETETGVEYIDFLKNTDKKYIVMDEYSWISDRKPLDEYLLTAVQNGKRILITAAESISLDFLNYGSLNHRVLPVHTTMFTYEEYLRLYNKKHSGQTCMDFLTEGGLFESYLPKSFDAAKEYMETAIVQNLAGYLKNEMSEEKARVLAYTVLFKAICPSNLSSVPVFRKSHVTPEDFLKQMCVHGDYKPSENEINRIEDIFEQVGIIVRIPAFCKGSSPKNQYYITNPSLTWLLIKSVYGIHIVDDSIWGYLFEASIAVQLFTNMLSKHKIYFFNKDSKNDSTDHMKPIFVITDSEKEFAEFAYFFECEFTLEEPLKAPITMLSDAFGRQAFSDTAIKIVGRYIVYNGNLDIREYNGIGTIVFTPIGSVLDHYFEFDENVRNILSRSQKKGESL